MICLLSEAYRGSAYLQSDGEEKLTSRVRGHKASYLQPHYTGQQDKCKRQKTTWVGECYDQWRQNSTSNFRATNVLKLKNYQYPKLEMLWWKMYTLNTRIPKDSFDRVSPSYMPETVQSSQDKLVNKTDNAPALSELTLLWKTWTNTETNHFR